MSPRKQSPEKESQEQMENSVVEREGTVLNRSVVRQNTATILQSNPALTFAVVTLTTSESLTTLDSNPTAPSNHLPARKLASVPIRPLAVPVTSSPRPSSSTQTCLRFAYGVHPLRTLADCVASGASHCMSLGSDTSATPVLHDGSRAAALSHHSLPRMPWAPLARAPLAQATLGVL